MKISNLKVTDADVSFIKFQLRKNNKVRKIEKDSIKNINWHNWYNDELPVTNISLPVFSNDGNTAFISFYFHCGDLCGNGAIQIFKKVDGKWKRFPIKFWGTWNN